MFTKSIKYLALVPIIFSCSESEIVKVRGNLLNFKGKEISISSTDTTYSFPVDSTKSFSIEMTLPCAKYMELKLGEQQILLYLLPNSNLTISVDIHQFDSSLSLSGYGSNPSTYLFEASKLNKQLPQGAQQFSADPIVFANFIDSLASIKNSFLSDYKDKLPNSFYQLEKGRIDYERLSYYNRYISRRWFRSKNFDPLPEEFLAYRDEIEYDREDLVIPIREYQNTLGIEIMLKPRLGLEINDAESINTYFNGFIEIADSLIDSPIILGKVLETHFHMNMRNTNTKIIRSRLEEYKEVFEPKIYEELTETLYDLISSGEKGYVPYSERFPRGAQVPDFLFKSPEGESIKISEFKGKLVYVDLWATWCGPCLQEQPFMEKLIEEYDEAPVVFLAISIDNTQTPWKKMLEDRELGGTHVFAENNWSADIMKHFVVEGIPRYLLLDHEGKILDANAPRPSGNIAEVLAEELAKIAL